jgi:hypothetical protein
MRSQRSRILYVTDFAYQARGRRYCDEDIFVTARLREEFVVATCAPTEAARLMAAMGSSVRDLIG